MGFAFSETLSPPHLSIFVPSLGALSAVSSRARTAESVVGREPARLEERSVVLRPAEGLLLKTPFLVVRALGECGKLGLICTETRTIFESRFLKVLTSSLFSPLALLSYERLEEK